MIRLIVPDSHGAYIDKQAMKVFLQDLSALDPDEIVMMGDHVDCSGVFSKHKRSYRDELEYSYKKDIEYARLFLDAIQSNAPRAKIYYIEGNHEQRAERWAVDTFSHPDDVSYAMSTFGPAAQLDLDGRGIEFFRMSEFYCGLTIPGTIKLGKCHFVHGICANKYATATHLEKFGDNVVHAHTHRMQQHSKRTVANGEIGAWCPGTLSELQPLYAHTNPTDWSHGYGLQFVNAKTGSFLHLNVPIVNGQSLLFPLVSRLESD